jgi:hypothetical protein
LKQEVLLPVLVDQLDPISQPRIFLPDPVEGPIEAAPLVGLVLGSRESPGGPVPTVLARGLRLLATPQIVQLAVSLNHH